MRYLKVFLQTKWIFNPPKKKDVLVFDGNNNPFEKYISKKKLGVLYSRGEKLNIFILIRCVLKNKFSVNGYFKEYIEYVNPKLIITFIDNSVKFYELKKMTKCKTAFIQNGLRSEVSDIFSKKMLKKIKNKDLKVDHMFVFNKIIGKRYNSFIKGSFHEIGSFNNNSKKISRSKKKEEILLISTFRNYDKSKTIDNNTTWGEFSKNDNTFIKYLITQAEKDNIKINVLGRYSLKNNKSEFEYFKYFFKKKEFGFIDNYKGRDPYKLIDAYKYSFTIDSTLGIENLSRGGRTGFFCNRPNKYPFISRKFGWMEGFANKGPFWTYSDKESEFIRVYKNVIFKNLIYWKNIKKKYTSKIMPYDDKNKIFTNFIKLSIKKGR